MSLFCFDLFIFYLPRRSVEIAESFVVSSLCRMGIIPLEMYDLIRNSSEVCWVFLNSLCILIALTILQCNKCVVYQFSSKTAFLEVDHSSPIRLSGTIRCFAEALETSYVQLLALNSKLRRAAMKLCGSYRRRALHGLRLAPSRSLPPFSHF